MTIIIKFSVHVKYSAVMHALRDAYKINVLCTYVHFYFVLSLFSIQLLVCFRFHRWLYWHLTMPSTLRTGTFTHNIYLFQRGRTQMVVQSVALSMFHISIQITNRLKNCGMMVMKLQFIQSRKFSFLILYSCQIKL